jgi:hypothetical protein
MVNEEKGGMNNPYFIKIMKKKGLPSLLYASIKATMLGRYSYLFHQTEMEFLALPVLLFHRQALLSEDPR